MFLFHAKDDSNVAFSESAAFSIALMAAGNAQVTFVSAESGDHYAPMIDEGIPRAIEWAAHMH